MAVTVTYLKPVAGVTAPTTTQSAKINEVIAQVTATADADVAATVTHNFQISAANLALGYPRVSIELMLPAGWLSTPYIATGGKTTNAVAITMSSAVGSGNANPQFQVNVQRPYSPTT